jgi:peptide/nickel transport system substrate-binding protein
VPMTSLLPPALMPQEPPARPAAKRVTPQRELELFFDGGLLDQRAVAERLQVRLHDLGFRATLRPLSRAGVRAKWASGDYDLLLHGVLLPPLAAPALAVVLELAGAHDRLARELPPLGAVADPAAREQRARARALELRAELPLLPLYAQSVRVTLSPKVRGLEPDAFGVPRLDGAFLAPE